MVHQTSLEHYCEEVQTLLRNIAAGEKEPADLLHLLEEELHATTGDSTRESFLMGELAFYQKQYKAALKHYMKAKDVPSFHFFCYRTCAFLFDEDNNREKALEFVQKALALQPDDWTATALCTGLMAGKEYQDSDVATAVSLGTEEFDELSMLFQEKHEEAPAQHKETSRPAELATEVCQALERRIANFQDEQKRRLREYTAQARVKIPHQDYLFHVLDGWQEQKVLPGAYVGAALLEQRLQRTTGGYFLKWHGKGIAINPGVNFLTSLHRQGLRIDDIDCVIVTKSSPESYSDVKEIYNLNKLVNSTQDKLHIIHYYLCHSVYQTISRTLKPHFKQERNSVHCLELYLDSPDIETVILDDGIILHYFPTSAQSPAKADEATSTTIGIRLDLTGPAQAAGPQSHAIKVGYISGTSWSPWLAEHLHGCDLLIAGIEETHSDDYSRVKYNSNSLGYFGCLSLLEAVNPRLMLCCEFAADEGDIRVEITKKLRSDFNQHNSRPTTILPGNLGLKVDLTTMQILCAASHTFVDPNQVHVARTSDDFGSLHYLSSQCLL